MTYIVTYINTSGETVTEEIKGNSIAKACGKLAGKASKILSAKAK